MSAIKRLVSLLRNLKNNVRLLNNFSCLLEYIILPAEYNHLDLFKQPLSFDCLSKNIF